MERSGRYTGPGPATLAEGWTFKRLTSPSRLFGANGLRTGADGRVYVAQVSGSQISAIDINTGDVETISPMGAGITGPDDLVFDPEGNIYATEITEGRVTMRAPNGTYRVIHGDMPVANPITWSKGRLIAGELRMDGRIMELDRSGGGSHRVILDNVPMPNAMEVGPDGLLYFPVMGVNEIWRVDPNGGKPEKVVGYLGLPDAVKFDSKGFIVSTQVRSGQVLRIDPRNGNKTVLANLPPGLDNLTFVGERLFVSNISGFVVEILADGKVRNVVPDGFNWPLGLAMLDDGRLFVADGAQCRWLLPNGELQPSGMLFSEGYPGYVRGVAASGPGEVVVTTANGTVARFRPDEFEHEVLAQGFAELYGIAAGSDGAVVFADQSTGRVHSAKAGKVEELASGLLQPCGVAVGSDGTVYVSEFGGKRVVKLAGGRAEAVVDDLKRPQGILERDGKLYIVDVLAKEVVEFDIAKRTRRTIAGQLPVGSPPNVGPHRLRGIAGMSGAAGPFSGIASGADGTLYVSGDADGTVLALRPR
jgi:sugar lactone lactonase YvrE